MSESTEADRLRAELKRAVAQRDLYVRELTSTSQRFEEKVRELSVVRRIGESLKYTRDVRKVFEVIIDTIIDETNAENCSLMLLNRDTDELMVKAARGQTDTISTYFHSASRTGRTFRKGEGIAGWVAQHGEIISIPDISKDSRFVSYSSSSGAIGSLLCIPLIIDNEIVGVVNMSHPRPNAFSSEDERLMAIITDQVAIALNNVQVFDDMQQLNVVLEDEVEKATQKLRRTNVELQLANDEIRTASQMKSQFLAHMSHEL